MKNHWAPYLVIFLFFTVLSLLLLYPVVAELTTSLPGEGDPLLILWLLLHEKSSPGLLQAPALYPYPYPLTLTEPMLLLRGLAHLISPLTQEKFVVFNLLLIVGFILSGSVTAWCVYKELTSLPAAILSGVIFTFNSFMWYHRARLHLVHAYFVPLILYLLYRVIRTRSFVPWMSMWIALMGQFLISIYYGIFLLITVCITVLLSFKKLKNILITEPIWRRVVSLILPFILFLFLFVLYFPYLDTLHLYGFHWNAAYYIQYSAQLSDLLTSVGWLHRVVPLTVQPRIEGFLYPGIIGVGLCMVALYKYRKSAWSVVLLFLFAVGSAMGTNIPLFRFMYQFPPFSLVRVPSRWWIVGVGLLSLGAGFGVAVLFSKWKKEKTLAVWLITFALISFQILDNWSFPRVRSLHWVNNERLVHRYLRNDPQTRFVASIPSWTTYGPMSIMLYWQMQYKKNYTGGLFPFYPEQQLNLFRLIERVPDLEASCILNHMQIKKILIYPYLTNQPERFHRFMDRLQKTPQWQGQIEQFGSDNIFTPKCPDPYIRLLYVKARNLRRVEANCEIEALFEDPERPQIQCRLKEAQSIIAVKIVAPRFPSTSWRMMVLDDNGATKPVQWMRLDVAWFFLRPYEEWIQPFDWDRPITLYIFPLIPAHQFYLTPESPKPLKRGEMLKIFVYGLKSLIFY